MNRGDWQKFAVKYVSDAKALLAARRWSAAYYLTGYAVECGLKACVLARVASEPEVMFADRRFSDRCWTHDLSQLMSLAGLTAQLDAATAADPQLKLNWEMVKEWDEGSRYERKARVEARRLYAATLSKNHGVFPWIKARW